MIVKDKLFKLDFMNKQLEKIIDDAVKPMSILEIKEKFNLSFPFKVKRVVDSIPPVFTNVTNILEIRKSTIRGYITNNYTDHFLQSAELKHYILVE